MATWPELPLIQVLRNGKTLDLRHPDPAVIDIQSIAIPLSRIPRWSGSTIQFYSVAQHCVNVAHLVAPELQLAALLHDAHEALTGCMDMSCPVKQRLEFVKVIEEGIDEAIAARYGFDVEQFYHRDVQHADAVMCSTEIHRLMPPTEHVWPRMPTPLRCKLVGWPSHTAEIMFLSSFRKFGGIDNAPSITSYTEQRKSCCSQDPRFG